MDTIGPGETPSGYVYVQYTHLAFTPTDAPQDPMIRPDDEMKQTRD